MPNKQLNPFAEGVISLIGSQLVNSPDGEYYIPGITLADWQNPQVQLLAGLMNELVYRYHDYVWKETEALFNPNGITISWQRKKQSLERRTPDETPHRGREVPGLQAPAEGRHVDKASHEGNWILSIPIATFGPKEDPVMKERALYSAEWYMDNAGYIHGGFDSPIFLKAKKKHNTRLTANKHKESN